MKLKYYCIFCQKDTEFTLRDGQFKCDKCGNNLQVLDDEIDKD